MPYSDQDQTNYCDVYNARLPRRPLRAVTASSYNEPRRSSRRHATPSAESRRKGRIDREELSASRRNGGSATQGNEEESRRERRKERRRSRAARDPEGEARRQERRRERRQKRDHERAAQDSRPEARRRERHSTRRADSDVFLHSEQRDVRDIAEFEKENTTLPYSAAGHGHLQNKDKEYGDQYESSTPRSDYQLKGSGPLPQHAIRHSSEEASRLPRTESWQSSEDDWKEDIEKSSLDEKYPYSRTTSSYDELQWYKRGTIPEHRHHYDDERGCFAGRRRCAILSLVAAILLLIIIITVAVVVSRNKFKYTPSTAQVNNTAVFTSGGATLRSVNDTDDGIGAGTDRYTYYQGDANMFPNNSRWISFEDMWSNHVLMIQQACGWLNYGADDSEEEIQDIYNAIQDRANSSLVDHRLILAVILQESRGCVHVPHTTSSGGVHNTGLMQAHDGQEFDTHYSRLSILAMVQDGTQGTKNGDGLVQLLNTYGNPYKALRGYNSGYIPSSGDLSEAAGATACYVSDIANLLTGWVKAASSCPGE